MLDKVIDLVGVSETQLMFMQLDSLHGGYSGFLFTAWVVKVS